MEARRRIPALLSLLGTAALLTTAAARPAAATVYDVDTTADLVANDGFCSLREAIRAADQDVAYDTCPAGDAADVIHLPMGIYDFSHGGETIHGPGTLEIEGVGPFASVVDLGGLNRFLELSAGSSVGLSSLGVSNGADFWGGAIEAVESTLSLESVRFLHCVAYIEGGALRFYSASGSLLAVDVTFEANQGLQLGGGASISVGDAATAELRDAWFDDNTSDRVGGLSLFASGGATGSCSRCTFVSNATLGVDGGGAGFRAQTGGVVRVVDAFFQDNQSLGDYEMSSSFWAAAWTGASIELDRIRTELAETTAPSSVDVRLVAHDDARIIVTNALLARANLDGLLATADGTSSIEISHATIVGFTGSTGATLEGFEAGHLRIENSIVAQNGINLLVTPESVEAIDDFVGGDPLFVENDDLYHLAPGSPAIDACDSPTAPYRVADLEHRPRVVGAAPDCGAQEAGGGIFADGFETGDAGSWSLTY